MEKTIGIDMLKNEEKSLPRNNTKGKNTPNINHNNSFIDKDVYQDNLEDRFNTNTYKEVSDFLNNSGKNMKEKKIIVNNVNKIEDKNNLNKEDNFKKFPSNSSWNPPPKKKKQLSTTLNYETDGQSKRLYYKQIKAKNIQNTKKIINKRRLEFIFKFIFYIISNIMNIVSVINYIIQTYFERKTDESSEEIIVVTEYLEIIFSYYFLCELLLFLYMKRKYPLKYVFSFDFLIDFITIFPPIISSFLDNRLFRFQYIRVLRIFRVFRILRVYKTLKNLQVENLVVTAEDESGSKLNPIKLQFYTILVILFCNFFISAGLILGLSDLIADAFNKHDMNFFDSFYFIIVTSSTLGYGDIVPTHPVTRLLIITSLFSLVIIVSNQVSKLSLILRTWGPGSTVYKFKQHLILVIDSSINYIYVLQSLQKKYEDKDIIVISKEELIFTSPLLKQKKIKLMHVLDYDLEAFDRANIKNAMAILIFTEKVTFYFDHKEKIVDFLLLKLHRFYSEVPIYLQTLFSDRSSFTGRSNSKNIRFKKIVPIMKIKSLIESKSLFNPGFACFIQNLIFNDTRIPDDYETYNPLMKNYFFGTENKIVIKQFPEYFYNMQFSEAVYIIYLKSIAEHFVKIQTSDKQTNRAILLIGIMEKNKFNVYDKEEVKIFPEKYIIKSKSQGVFISYNGLNYVEKFLKSFEFFIKETVESKLTVNKNPKNNSKKQDPLNLDLILSEEQDRIAKNNFYRRTAIIDTINNNIFKISNGLIQGRPFYNLNPNEVINENEEENVNESLSEGIKEEIKLRKRKTKVDLKHFNTIKELKQDSSNKSINNLDENLKESESFKNIKDEFCIEKAKNNSLFKRRISVKVDSESDFNTEKKRHNGLINSFLKKYGINPNRFIDKSVGFRNQTTRRSFENESLIDKNDNKRKNKNPFSTTKIKHFMEEDEDDFLLSNEKAKKSKNDLSKYSNKKMKLVRSKDSSKKTKSNPHKSKIKKFDSLITNDNKAVTNHKNTRTNLNVYEKLKEEERNDLTYNKLEMSSINNDLCYDSLEESYHSSIGFSSFSNGNEIVRKNIPKPFSTSLKDKKEFLWQNAKTKSEKILRLEETKPQEDYRNSTKDKQTSTKIVSEIDEELKKIDISSMKISNDNVNNKENKDNKNNPFELKSTGEEKKGKIKRINTVSNNYLQNMDGNAAKSPIRKQNSCMDSVNNFLKFNKNNKTRRSSLAIDMNNIDNLVKKNFREDFQTMKGIQKISNINSTRRYSLDENSLYKSNLAKLKRGSVYYTNNDILKNLFINNKNNINKNKDDVKSSKSKSVNSSNINATEHNLTGVNKKNYLDKMQVLNSSSSVCSREEEGEDGKKFKQSNRGILYDKTNFKSKNTKRNLDFLNKFEHIYDKKIMEEINKKKEEHYSELRNLVYKSAENDYIFDHRIFEIDKIEAQEIFSDHILLIGYQDALDKFVKLITFHFPKKAICFLGTEDQRLIICNKLLKQYKNVYFFQGDPTNPFHLLNAGMNNAYQVIILSENIFKKLNEDMSVLLTSRLTDYYFDINMLIELWDSKSAKLLGYIPLDKRAKDIHNEFYHPLFMSGRLIYLSHLDKLTTLSVTDPNVIETLYQLISVGFRKLVNNFAHRRTDINLRLGGDVPVMITIDLPEHYWGKEYYVLVQDLLTLEKPAIPFGLYITDPLSYHLLDSQGKISQSQKNQLWKIINSHKRRLINFDSMGRFESAYFNNMKFLRDISYTDKIVLNYVDLKRTHLPIFITNPLPGFILSKDCKVLIMTNYTPTLRILDETNIGSRKEMQPNVRKYFKKNQPPEIPVDDKIRQCQENYLKLLESLNKQFSNNYIEALKNAEKIKKSLNKDK